MKGGYPQHNGLYENIRNNMVNYGHEYKEMEYAFGPEMTQGLDELDLAEETLFIFTNDHGGFDNEPLRSNKGNMYEGGLRVPFIARWPGRIPAGETSDAFCSQMDLMPTFTAVADADFPNDVIRDGCNILPVWTDGADSPRNTRFWELRGKRAARIGDWKWVMENDERWTHPDADVGELFDLSEDLGEENDLAETMPEKEQELRERWESWIREMADAEPRGPFSKAYFDLLGYGDGSYRIELNEAGTS